MTENTTENTYQITLSSGRAFTVRPLPKHFFIYYGELPTALMNQAAESVKNGSEKAFETALTSSLSPEEIKQFLIFVREAVNHFCVSPRITLAPKGKDEISPFEITEKEFAELSALAMQSVGGLAEGLNSFRTESEQIA